VPLKEVKQKIVVIDALRRRTTLLRFTGAT